MFAIVGTVPDKDFPLVCDTVTLDGGEIVFGNRRVAVNRGTPAMIAAAVKALEHMGKPNPFCYLIGDIGDGEGCKHLYRHLINHLPDNPFETLAFHYFQPILSLFKRMMGAIDTMPTRPYLIADAGIMYVAKMAGEASAFDLFTPDAGELAYLADEKAPHPFYTRGFILQDDNLVPDLITRAYQYKNASTHLLVKGATDFVANRKGIIATIDSPSVETLEPIGGTGDTLTGVVSALIAAGMDVESACTKAAKVNRLAGLYANPSPATQVYEIIKQIPRALEEAFKD